MTQLTETISNTVEFAWIELTNLCNLRCTHCYSESSPFSADKDLLKEDDYIRILDELLEIGCKQVQFIGGEPTLNRSLPLLIEHAADAGFEFIEVFSNLVSVRDDVWRAIETHNVALATSFYSFDRDTHNAITKSPLSYDRTVSSLRRAIKSGLTVRAGFIEMDQNQGHYEKTKAFLEALGVPTVGYDYVRAIGRANENEACDMGELCGSCSGKLLSIGPDGAVAPCNMSKAWKVGSLLESSLSELAQSALLADTRNLIGKAVIERADLEIDAVCTPKTCGPYNSCCPSTQQCGPCAPNGCSPCFPKG